MAKSFKDYTVEEAWNEIERVMNENPKPFEDVNVIYQYDLSGDDGGSYQLHLVDGKAKAVKGVEAEPNCTLQMSVGDFQDMIMGNLNGTAAFMSGKLKVKGDIGKAMKLESILRQYDVSQYA